MCKGFRWLGRGQGSRVPAPCTDSNGSLIAAPPTSLSLPPSNLSTFQQVPAFLCTPWGTGDNPVYCTFPTLDPEFYEDGLSVSWPLLCIYTVFLCVSVLSVCASVLLGADMHSAHVHMLSSTPWDTEHHVGTWHIVEV